MRTDFAFFFSGGCMMADVVALAAILSSIIFLYGEDVTTALVTRTLVRVFPGAETIDVGEQAFKTRIVASLSV